MMRDWMMNGGMMWGMGIVWLLVVAVLVLAIASDLLETLLQGRHL
jgi:hypothetical protein